MAFRYPEHPNSNRRDPFKDDAGMNPYADVQQVEQLDDNAYAASAETHQGAYQPTEYVASGHGRGGMLVTLGGLGFLSALVASLSVLAGVFGGSGFYFFMASGPLLLGAAASCAAWLLARHDLRAMRAGAMLRQGVGKTQVGLFLGVFGSLLSAAPLVVLIVSFVRAILAEL